MSTEPAFPTFTAHGAAAAVPAAPAVAATPRAELWLDPALPIGEALSRAFRDVLAYAGEWAGRALEDPTTAVHEYRKSVRRARALVRLARPLMKRARLKELDGTLREAVLETSSLRDADVLGETVKALPRSPLLTEAVARLREVLAAQQAQACTPAQVADVLGRGATVLALQPARFERALQPRTSWGELVRALRESYRRCRDTFEVASEPDHTDDEIHDWRKRVKELRYQLEMLEPASAARAEVRGLAPPVTRESELGKLAKVLGQITDLMVLREAVRSHDAALGPAATELLVDVLSRMIPARFVVVAALGETFFAVRPGVFARALLGVSREDDPPLPTGAEGELEPRPVEVERVVARPVYPHPVGPAPVSVGRPPLAIGVAPPVMPPTPACGSALTRP